MMKKAVLILILISTTFSLFAATTDNRAQELFFQANKAYEQGKYKEAVDRYLKALPVAGDNSVLFFNLGNAYYKSGQLGEAVLYYRKALQLSPRDEDVKQNLEIARLHIKDKIVEPDPGFVFKVIARLHNFLSIDELTVITLTLYLLLCSVIIYRIYAKTGPADKAGYSSGLITFLIIILVFPTISLAVKIY